MTGLRFKPLGHGWALMSLNEACGPTGVSGAAWGRAALCARGRRPARSPSALRAFGSARRIEARPGPATAHGHRSLARRFLWASWGSRVLSFWGALVRVVTSVVNPRCFLCGFLRCCYKRRQSEGFFAENGGFWA